jgi:hypothetical protein
MKQIQMFLLLAVLISAAGVSGRQVASGGSSPADILYAQPGTLVSVKRISAESLLHGERSAHCGFRFRMGRLGARVVEGAARDLQMDARLQL